MNIFILYIKNAHTSKISNYNCHLHHPIYYELVQQYIT